MSKDGILDGRDTVGAELQSAISAVVRWASRQEVRRELWTVKGFDLSPTDVWLIEAIGDSGPLRLTQLAAWQGVDKSTVTPQVRRLEKAGIVAREPDPDDGRAARLTLTVKGRRVRRRLEAEAARMLDHKLAGWAPEDRRALGALLGRFAHELNADAPDPAER